VSGPVLVAIGMGGGGLLALYCVPRCTSLIVRLPLPVVTSVRISFAKTDPFPKRASGGKPVQGHGSVALTNPAQGEFASKKCSNVL
jgi:hypothetical protein